jgi:hypothetical protein
MSLDFWGYVSSSDVELRSLIDEVEHRHTK